MGALFGAIISGIEWLAGAVATGAAAVASAALALATTVWNGLKAAGHLLSLFGHEAWSFLRDTWDKVLEPAFRKVFHFTVTAFKDLWSKVLKPAWQKFNQWIDRAHDWLATKFGPILCWLQKARKALSAFYTTYIRPWLDFIDATRKVLQLLEALHVAWARELDRKLAQLEDRIARPFLLVLSKLNEIVTLIDRVVTFDGLFQRVALVNSLARDFKEAWQAIANPYSTPVPQAIRDALKDARKSAAATEIETVVRPYLHTPGAAQTELQTEIRLLWLAHLAR